MNKIMAVAAEDIHKGEAVIFKVTQKGQMVYLCTPKDMSDLINPTCKIEYTEKKRSILCLKVEVFPGSCVYETMKEMIELSKRMNLTIESKFNGATILATPYSNYETMCKQYDNRNKIITGVEK